MVIPVTAEEDSAKNLESETADRIEQMFAVTYADYPGQYVLGNAFSIYNADTVCVYYILPIFQGEECAGIVEVNTAGSVTITNDTSLYSEINTLSSPAYLLYTTGGAVYAEFADGFVELYDSGFDIPENVDFVRLSYSDKVETAEVYLQTAIHSLDISTVISETKLPCIVNSGISLCAIDPLVETETCSITNFVSQGNYNLCWAACVATIVNYKNGNDLSAANVATAMGHNYASSSYLGATISETLSALSLYGLSYSSTSAKLTWTSIKNNIWNNRPFIIGLTAYANGGYLGHMLTGYGYTCQSGDEDSYSSSRYVYVWNPHGSRLTLQYNATSYTIGGYSWNWIDTLID